MQRSATLSAFAAAAAGLVLSACEGPPPAPAPGHPEVTVAQPLVRPIIDWDGFLGRFEAVERVDVRPRVSGYVEAVHFEDGGRVEAGQPMFTIDPRPFQAALDEANGRAAAASARLENVRTELERARGLLDVRAVSREEFEALEAAARTAEAELAAARAAVRAHELNLEFTRVAAPIAGRASDRRIDPGNAVRADETVLTTVVSEDPIHFVFQGSEALYLKYRRASAAGAERPVRIRLQDESEHRWIGRLDFLDNAMDADSGTIRGRAVVDNPDGFLTPGLFGHMQLQASDEYEGLLLPDSAIVTRGADRIVYVVEDGVVSAKVVELGPLNGGLRVIRAGLAAADRVIVDGQQRARPGIDVETRRARIQVPGAGAGSAALVAIDAAGAEADGPPGIAAEGAPGAARGGAR